MPAIAQRRYSQFNLAALFEYMTVCAVASAFSAVIGVASSICLMLLGLALWARAGGLAVLALMGAFLLVNVAHELPPGDSTLTREVGVALLGTGLCVWYQVRRRMGGMRW